MILSRGTHTLWYGLHPAVGQLDIPRFSICFALVFLCGGLHSLTMFYGTTPILHDPV
ncbi:hypothetical protein BKA82DRAFT_1007715 [Pisolithus tinctorius]|uniref:Uncharacterized protein n=1 Tax=Pisolithus tinctorius Marx 270 TaxID=870435 RepID=A0A0C3JC37_PISTI|nr:hypothetical protein BKA82DRAFT_1007715 [Pisolithus tinctorius]KIN95231.1 hypothetical protein M404DRAFT_1007715 [Pisolithus tinctorius Marx 270]